MDHFSVINPAGQQLLQEVDTTSMRDFLKRYNERFTKSYHAIAPERIRRYLLASIDRVLSGEPMWQSARDSADRYMRWYDHIFYGSYEGESDRSEVRDLVEVPESEFDFDSARKKIFTNLLLHNAPLLEPFLSEYSQEIRLRVIQALLANELHPLGFTDHDSYSWLSHSLYRVTQTIHGDIYFARYGKQNNPNQRDMLSQQTIDRIEDKAMECFGIYQYPECFVGMICRYALATGYVPQELQNWKELTETITPVIPNATTADPSKKDPEHIALLHKWDWEQEGAPLPMDTTGTYRYLGNEIMARPPDHYHVALLRWESLVLAMPQEDGDICFRFPSWHEEKYRKAFEFQKEDIGPALVAIFHLPGRSIVENRYVLEAFDVMAGANNRKVLSPTISLLKKLWLRFVYRR